MNENTQKEIEKLRKQISQQEKMASLGLLSAGIAHEIQNPLNFVINFSKVSQKLLKDMQEVLNSETHYRKTQSKRSKRSCLTWKVI